MRRAGTVLDLLLASRGHGGGVLQVHNLRRAAKDQPGWMRRPGRMRAPTAGRRERSRHERRRRFAKQMRRAEAGGSANHPSPPGPRHQAAPRASAPAATRRLAQRGGAEPCKRRRGGSPRFVGTLKHEKYAPEPAAGTAHSSRSGNPAAARPHLAAARAAGGRESVCAPKKMEPSSLGAKRASLRKSALPRHPARGPARASGGHGVTVRRCYTEASARLAASGARARDPGQVAGAATAPALLLRHAARDRGARLPPARPVAQQPGLASAASLAARCRRSTQALAAARAACAPSRSDSGGAAHRQAHGHGQEREESGAQESEASHLRGAGR